MKILAKPIEVICKFDVQGKVEPIEFKIDSENGIKVIPIDRINKRSNEKLAGNPMLIFECESVIGAQRWRYEIKYENSTCKWMLFKIWKQ